MYMPKFSDSVCGYSISTSYAKSPTTGLMHMASEMSRIDRYVLRAWTAPGLPRIQKSKKDGSAKSASSNVAMLGVTRSLVGGTDGINRTPSPSAENMLRLR